MASVDLAGNMWLNLVADDLVAMAFAVNSIELDATTGVSIRPNALGEQRAVATPGKAMGAKIGLVACTDAQQAWLLEHQGEPVWFRPPLTGVKFAAFYTPDSGYQPRPIGDSWSIPLTFTAYTQPDLL